MGILKSEGQELVSLLDDRCGYIAKNIDTQVKQLQNIFPNLDLFDKHLSEQLIFQAQKNISITSTSGFFAIPMWNKVASTYNKATAKVLDILKDINNSELYAGFVLRESDYKKNMMDKLHTQQGGHDVVFLQAQFGFRYQGLSYFEALESMVDSEFSLGVFEVGVMLITHSERLSNNSDLWIDCGGDEAVPDSNDNLVGVPTFGFLQDHLLFGANKQNISRYDCGLATAFIL